MPPEKQQGGSGSFALLGALAVVGGTAAYCKIYPDSEVRRFVNRIQESLPFINRKTSSSDTHAPRTTAVPPVPPKAVTSTRPAAIAGHKEGPETSTATEVPKEPVEAPSPTPADEPVRAAEPPAPLVAQAPESQVEHHQHVSETTAQHEPQEEESLQHEPHEEKPLQHEPHEEEPVHREEEPAPIINAEPAPALAEPTRIEVHEEKPLQPEPEPATATDDKDTTETAHQPPEAAAVSAPEQQQQQPAQEDVTPKKKKKKESQKENQHLQPSASPELFRDIFTMQKETYEKMLAEKDQRLKRKLEKQKAALAQQHERELQSLKHELQRELELQEQLQAQRNQEQQQLLDAERREIMAEAEALVAREALHLEGKFRGDILAEKESLLQQLQVHHENRMGVVSGLAVEIDKHSKSFEEYIDFSKRSISAHTLSLALVELSAALEQHAKPFAPQLRRLQETAKGEQLIEAAADSISDLAERGVYSYDRLKQRFGSLKKHVRRVSVVPPNGGMWWHAFGTMFAAAGLPPSLLNMQGEQMVEVLERAERRLEAGELQEAIAEVETLQGTPKELARDWLSVAKDRVVLEQALRMVFAELETMTPA